MNFKIGDTVKFKFGSNSVFDITRINNSGFILIKDNWVHPGKLILVKRISTNH